MVQGRSKAWDIGSLTNDAGASAQVTHMSFTALSPCQLILRKEKERYRIIPSGSSGLALVTRHLSLRTSMSIC